MESTTNQNILLPKPERQAHITKPNIIIQPEFTENYINNLFLLGQPYSDVDPQNWEYKTLQNFGINDPNDIFFAPKNTANHAAKHGASFGIENVEEYVDIAKVFSNRFFTELSPIYTIVPSASDKTKSKTLTLYQIKNSHTRLIIGKNPYGNNWNFVSMYRTNVITTKPSINLTSHINKLITYHHALLFSSIYTNTKTKRNILSRIHYAAYVKDQINIEQITDENLIAKIIKRRGSLENLRYSDIKPEQE